jgi:hypothetical protein
MDQIARQDGESLVVTVRPAVFDQEIAALDIAGLNQALTEGYGRLRIEPSAPPNRLRIEASLDFHAR